MIRVHLNREMLKKALENEYIDIEHNNIKSQKQLDTEYGFSEVQYGLYTKLVCGEEYIED